MSVEVVAGHGLLWRSRWGAWDAEEEGREEVEGSVSTGVGDDSRCPDVIVCTLSRSRP